MALYCNLIRLILRGLISVLCLSTLLLLLLGVIKYKITQLENQILPSDISLANKLSLAHNLELVLCIKVLHYLSWFYWLHV